MLNFIVFFKRSLSGLLVTAVAVLTYGDFKFKKCDWIGDL